MTVGQLKKLLENVPDGLQIVFYEDPELTDEDFPMKDVEYITEKEVPFGEIGDEELERIPCLVLSFEKFNDSSKR